jgi:hypothetical protein
MSPSSSVRVATQGSPDYVQTDTAADMGTEEARVCARSMRWTRREGACRASPARGGRHDDLLRSSEDATRERVGEGTKERGRRERERERERVGDTSTPVARSLSVCGGGGGACGQG